jgi:hypothetical protein
MGWLGMCKKTNLFIRPYHKAIPDALARQL